MRVITEYMGGGFGSKFGPDAQGIICAKLAKQAGAAVKLMLDRKEEHLAAGNRPSSFSKIKAGVAADGMLTAFDAETWGTGGAGVGAGFPLPYIYIFPNRRRRHRDVFTNAGPARAMRAPGHPQACFHTESLMDELADKVKMDPLEFRMKNLPAEAPNAQWRKYFPIGAEKIGWSRAPPDGRSIARARSSAAWAAPRTSGAAADAARRRTCEIHADGSVVVRCGTQDIGTGTRTHHAMADRRDARPAARRRSRPRSATATIRSAAAAAAARRPRRSRRRSASRPGRPSTRWRRGWRRRWASSRRRSSRATAAMLQ